MFVFPFQILVIEIKSYLTELYFVGIRRLNVVRLAV